jgi:hypothetical protein
MLDVRFFRGTDCDNNHCVVVAKVIEKLLGGTRKTQQFGMDGLNLKLNDVKIRKQYQVRV